MSKKTYRSLDLFSGAGGLSVGFETAGFVPLFANDHETPALTTYRRNHPQTLCTDEDIEALNPRSIRKKLRLDRGELDVLLGGPPCQGFSTYGKRDPHDARNRLFEHYCGFLEEFKPHAFVIENVVGILSMLGGAVIDEILAATARAGYSVRVVTLDARDFGVPQSRKRVFVLGGRDGTVPAPVATHRLPETLASGKSDPLFAGIRPDLPGHLTVRDAISDLPEFTEGPKGTHTDGQYLVPAVTSYQAEMRGSQEVLWHHSSKRMLGIRRLRLALLRPGDYGTKLRARLADGGLPRETVEEILGNAGGSAGMRRLSECRTEDRVKEAKLRELLLRGHTSPEEILSLIGAGGFANKYRRLKWDEPSHTLVAHMARDCSDFVHPELDRFISVREAARLQSFPDSYYFEGSQFQQFRQIGNAVPPKLGAAVARAVSALLTEMSTRTRHSGMSATVRASRARRQEQLG